MSSSIHTICDTDLGYPSLLRSINKPPAKIYLKGHLTSTLFTKCIAVVGSRNISLYGIRAVDYFVKELVRYGFTIVSGGVRGVDTVAHECAIKYQGQTLAVLPSGLDCATDMIHRRILESGNVLMSMFDSHQFCAKWTFAKRNEWIVGLSCGVLVVEAAENSGSLITANYSFKYKRPVFTVPGSIFSSVSRGCNILLSKGAIAAANPATIINYFNKPTQEPLDFVNLPKTTISADVSKIYKALATSAYTQEELSALFNIDYRQLSIYVSELLLSNMIFEQGGRFYVH